MKYSKQRETIYQWVCEHAVHPSADEVYSNLKQQYPALSLATVYRNLNLLAEHGKLQKIAIPQGGDRFDGNIATHYHAICDRCGKVYDLSIPDLNHLEQKLEEEMQFQVRRHHLVVSGICSGCREHTENEVVRQWQR